MILILIYESYNNINVYFMDMVYAKKISQWDKITMLILLTLFFSGVTSHFYHSVIELYFGNYIKRQGC